MNPNWLMHGRGLPTALLIAIIGFSPAIGYGQSHRGRGMARPSMTRSAPRFSPNNGIRPTFSRFNSNAAFRNANSFRSRGNFRANTFNWARYNNFNNWRRHHHRDNTFIFFGGFGWPWYYPYYDFYPAAYYYPYGYYPYGYDGYYSPDDYSNGSGYPDSSGGGGYYDDRYTDRPDYNQNGRTRGRSPVDQVQEELARAGYYKGPIDGVAGDRTYYAIRAYERDHHLRVDGAISDQLLREMGLRSR